ncbi:MAG TPA: hypothetical protein VJY62_06510 [Bacteroidia bacterium]|nr:hypothetical protein [Bacteroidia bacterium]
MKKIVILSAICALCTQANGQWNLTGNAGTNPSTNFIGTTDAKTFKIRTNNQVRMTVLSNGKVGIGTTAPAVRLHLKSNDEAMRIEGVNPYLQFHNGTFETGYVWSNGNDFLVGTNLVNSTGSFHIATAGYNRMTISATGNAAIGTVTPTARFDVQGNASSTLQNIYSRVNYIGDNDVRAISARSVCNPGWGVGVEAVAGYIGVSTFADAGTWSGSAYGVYSTCSGSSAGSRYGVYGYAYGGLDNWGGYFPTKSYASEMRIGSTQGATGYILTVDGKIICEEMRVALSGAWPDYVFNDDYKLMSLGELRESIETNKHLPGMPSANEMKEAGGYHIGEMQSKLVEKVEQLTLYILQQDEQISELRKEISSLKK